MVCWTGSTVRVHLRPDGRGKGFHCPKCKHRIGKMRERKQSVMDLPLGTASVVHLVFNVYQGQCAHCGTIHTFRPTGISAKAQGTDRLKRYVSLLCRFMSVDKVRNIVPISTDTARRWDKQVLIAHTTYPQTGWDSRHPGGREGHWQRSPLSHRCAGC